MAMVRVSDATALEGEGGSGRWEWKVAVAMGMQAISMQEWVVCACNCGGLDCICECLSYLVHACWWFCSCRRITSMRQPRHNKKPSNLWNSMLMVALFT